MDFISFDIAKTLKTKRFDVPVYASIRLIYSDRPDTKITVFSDPENFNEIPEEENYYCTYSCPLYQTVIDWLNSVHNIHIGIYPVSVKQYNGIDIVCYQSDIYRIDEKEHTLIIYNKKEHDSRKNAVKYVVEYCINNLIS